MLNSHAIDLHKYCRPRLMLYEWQTHAVFTQEKKEREREREKKTNGKNIK